MTYIITIGIFALLYKYGHDILLKLELYRYSREQRQRNKRTINVRTFKSGQDKQKIAELSYRKLQTTKHNLN